MSSKTVGNKSGRRKSPKVKKEVQEAVDQLSTQLSNELQDLHDMGISDTKRGAQQVDHDRGKRRLLWFGVVTLGLAVFVMWAWNAWTVLYDMRYVESEESTLFGDAKDDIDTILNTFLTGSGGSDIERAIAKQVAEDEQDDAQKEDTTSGSGVDESELRRVLGSAIAEQVATTSTSSTTDVATSTLE